MHALDAPKPRLPQEPGLFAEWVRAVRATAHSPSAEELFLAAVSASHGENGRGGAPAGTNDGSAGSKGTPPSAPPPRMWVYAASGLLVSLGAPLGWLFLRWLAGPVTFAGIGEEISSNSALYAYLTFGTSAAFATFGAAVGRMSDRLLAFNQHLAELAITDALTSLRNKRYFHERLKSEAARAQREERKLALILVDLDHFKAVNDRCGHVVGDRALTHVAGVLQEKIRNTDVACRVGGEEFGIICPGPSLAEARMVAERIRQAMEENPYRPDEREEPIKLTASVGVAVFRTSPEALFRAADAALYSAKRSGRNQVVVESPALLVENRRAEE